MSPPATDAVFHPLSLGAHIDPARPRGYYIDLRAKAAAPTWPPPWLHAPAGHAAVAIAQWGLACHEHWIAGEGEEWLAGAVAAGERMLADQTDDGRWLDSRRYPHTYRIPVPWPSAMAQGEGASLFVRLSLASGDERFAEGAIRALRPFGVPTDRGGVSALLAGSPFPEEYPTQPPAFVLNGAIFALWGAHDVAVGLADAAARRTFDEGVETLATNLHRWDTGSWSRYDLFPHPVVNLATLGYHRLHIAQLRALRLLCPHPVLEVTAASWQRYADSRQHRTLALVRKVVFRLLVRKPLRRRRVDLPVAAA